MDTSRLSFTHVAFADETNFNRGSFPGIGLISLPLSVLLQVNSDLRQILLGCQIDEFKWEKLHSAKRRFAAIQLIDYALEQTKEGRLRIDVLTWDLMDGRHRVPKPDRIANLQRMYFHLFRNVLRLRWPDEARWVLYPDEQTAITWPDVHHYLVANSTAVTQDLEAQPFTLDSLMIRKEFRILAISPCESKAEPLVQLADLFVGMGSYSRARFDKYKLWQAEQSGQELSQIGTLSHRDKERWQVINHLYRQCKANRLGVGLSRQPGLRTRNPRLPINFWWYVPQHEKDKAPSRP